jgi:pyruvate/2-oxoglutarate dehydrogenase complex dihydrolipoamide dehydrogenase (E3) component
MSYDVIVIGAGAGGLNVAVPCAKLGLKTLLIDKQPDFLGGECLITGCVPSKALLHIAKLKHDAAKLTQFGVGTTGVMTFAKIMEAIRNIQSEIRSHETPELLGQIGLEFAFGSARFVSSDSVQVGDQVYFARRIVIATGSIPSIPHISGIEHVPYLTYENIWTLDVTPEKMLVVGAGAVGVEMAQAFVRLGSKVTVLEKSSRLLSRDPPESSELLGRHLSDEGVRFLFNAELTRFLTPNTAEVKTSTGTGEEYFDNVLIATGKKLLHASLDLAKAGVEVNGEFIKIDPYLRTTNKRIYVCGDAVGQVFLTHVAELQSSVILYNLFSPFKRKVSYDCLNWVTFTDPEVATFGLSEQELQSRGVRYRKVVQGFEDVNRATIERYPESRLTVFLKKGRILGGTMVAPNAGELIQELVLAMQNKIALRKFLEKTYSYPVASRINRWLAIWEYDRKVTKLVKKILQVVFRLVS